jgi:hypothetical protein
MASVIEDLERARERLERAANAAREVEDRARGVLDFLRSEISDWTAEIESDKNFLVSTSKALKERWSGLSARVDALGDNAERAWESVRQSARSGWELLDGTWREAEVPFDLRRQEGQAFAGIAGSTMEAFRELQQRHEVATTDALRLVDDDLIAKTQSLMASISSRSEGALQSIQQAVETASAAVTEAGTSLGAAKESAASELSALSKSFGADIEKSVGSFKDHLDESIGGLESVAKNTGKTLIQTAETISDTATELMQGADDVADTLRATNVGLGTVVDIVNTGIQICEEVIGEWDS